ncbi:unnamed protein product [Allacma fusca]|uniref:Uncharacterized protein n=1 Tax=Allacma fusca TaxID=39272 RepID=A0A8J2P6L5_9HEXA|nr:unnamed protein product [Allacma fusca]
MELPAYFEALMHRAPIPASDIFTYLREMRRTPSGPLVTSKLLAGKIQSKSEAQAIHAFEFLEAALEAETEGSIEFRTEIGRYRFLNEIIRILSPKYLGEVTPKSVKERAVRFLCDAAGPKKQRWFPSEHSKIKMVYQSLVDTGIITKTAEEESAAADAAEAELQKSIFDRAENAAILKKLLSSTDPADLNAANRLIKSLADEESKRNERRSELHSLIDRIDTSTSLLTEMLNQPTLDKELTEDLAVTCNNLRQKLGSIPTETNDEITSVLQASENIEKVLKLHEQQKELKSKSPQSPNTTAENDLLNQPPISEGIPQLTSSFSLADELLMGLSDEFSIASNMPTKTLQGTDSENLLLNFDLDISSGEGKKLLDRAGSLDDEKIQKNPDTLDEIERLSRELMQQGLKNSQGRSPVFVVKKTERAATLNQLQKNSSTSSQEAPLNLNTQLPLEVDVKLDANHSNLTFLDLDFLENPNKKDGLAVEKSVNNSQLTNDLAPKKSPRGSTSNEDESLLNLSENQKNETLDILPSKVEQLQTKIQPSFNLNSVKEVDLDDIELHEKINPIELNLITETDGNKTCKDVNVTLTLGRVPDYPRSVRVAVITLSNRNSSSELFNYVFQLLPPKGMQVKLLAPSCMELSPWKKSFLPPPMLTQVALMSSSLPQFEKTRIKYILSYCLGEDTALHNGHFDLPIISSDLS